MLPVFRDLRRILPARGRGRAVAVFAVVSLALGIGGNAVFFSWINAFIFEPLPYHEPDRLVLLGESQKGRRTLAGVSAFTSLPTWDDVRSRSRTLEDFSAVRFRLLSLSQGDRSVSVRAGQATAGFFRTLGVNAVGGRTFTGEDGREGAPRVAVLTWEFWTERGGEESGLLGATLVLNGQPYLVIGVLPEGFDFLISQVDLWIPLRDDPATAPRDQRDFFTVARMPWGTDLDAARAEVAALSAAVEAEHPAELGDWEMHAYHLASELPDPNSRLHLAIVQGMVFFVLLIACANIGIILLARGEERRREMALRSALGARRRHIVSQHLRESLLVAGLGGLFGLALAVVGVGLVGRAVSSTILPRNMHPHLDGTVVLFTVGITVVAGLAFGLAPALQSLRQDHAEALKAGAGAIGGGGRKAGRVAGALVAVEIALCLVALGGGSVLVRAFQSVRQSDPGFEVEGLLVVEFGLPAWKYPDPDTWQRMLDDVEASAAGLAGVHAAGLVSQPPQSLIVFSTDTFRLADAPGGEGRVRPRAQLLWATPGYLPALGLPLLAGRFIESQDRRDSPPVAVLSERLAHRHFADRDPVGRRLGLRGETVEVVGVVGDVQQSLVPQAEGTLDGAIYLSRAQRPSTYSFLVLRTRGRGDAMRLAEPARRTLASVDPDIVVHAAETQDAYARRFTVAIDFTNVFVALFGLFALLLASLGTYGVVSHAVARRTHELGVRLAVGARPGAVVMLIARSGVLMATAGLAAGAVILAPVVLFARTLLEGFSFGAVDPLTLGGIAAVLLAVTLAAGIAPALRAASVDPVRVLRSE